MTIIAVTLNENGTLTMIADKLVGSDRRWVGERSKVHTLHLDKTVDLAFAGHVFELDHDDLFEYVINAFQKTRSTTNTALNAYIESKFKQAPVVGDAKFVTRVVSEYLNSQNRKANICVLITDGKDACSIDLETTGTSKVFVPSFSSIKPSRGDLAWIELSVAEVNSHTNHFGYARTEDLFKSITLLHELAGYPGVLPTVGEN